MKLFEVIPQNPIWLGGLKHITAGDEHYMRSVFLPNIMRFFKFVKKEKERKGACYGVFLAKDENLLLPAPADIVGKRKTGGDWRILKLEGRIPLIKRTLEAYETVSGYLIKSEAFNKWIEYKNLSNNDFQKLNDLIDVDRRTGIKIDREEGTAEEGFLYTQERIRLKEGVKLLFLARECYKKEGFFGGERNPATIREVSKNYEKSLKEIFQGSVKVERGKIYRFYLTSHTYLNASLEVSSSEKNITIRDFQGEKIDFKVLWLFSAGTEFISGFGKPALNMLKPGTVFLLEALESGRLNKLCQIFAEPLVNKVERFLDSGWNSGLLISEGGSNS